MPEPPTIAPSEALLIGWCFEDYLRFREHVPNWPFLGVLRTRLSPFLPDLKSVKARRLDDSEVPLDVCWIADNGIETGTAPRHPNTQFTRRDGAVFQRTVDASRHNLNSLLLNYLGNAVGLSQQYRRALREWHEGAIDHNQILETYTKSANRNGAVHSDADGSLDSPAEIGRLLNELAQFNELQSVFGLGREFGNLCATIHLYELGCSPDLFAPSLLRAIMTLYQADMVQRGTACFSAIKSLGDLFDDELGTLPVWHVIDQLMDEGEIPESVEKIEAAFRSVQSKPAPSSRTRSEIETRFVFHQAWMTFWVAFGEVIGSLREADESTLKVEYALPVPREFAIQRGDSIDKVRDVLQYAEKELNKPADSPSVAERIVATLVQCLEPLARRVWQKEFERTIVPPRGKPYSPGMRSVLVTMQGRFPKASNEHRFATTALSLYDSYRCGASHDLDSFECSFEEARHVLSAMKMLLVLSDSLKRKHNPKAK